MSLSLRTPGRFFRRLPACVLLGAIRFYQAWFSPLLRAVLGPTHGCRFAPSCSCYAAEAVQSHGAWRGSGLALRRLIKCTPLHPGGFDPVPPAAPRCTRVTATPFVSSRI